MKRKFTITPTGEEKEWQIMQIIENSSVDVGTDGLTVVTTKTTESKHFKTFNLQTVPLHDVTRVFLEQIQEVIMMGDEIVIFNEVQDS